MKSLKAKLVIQIITFILIFGDAYAGNFKFYINCKIILALDFSRN